MKWIKQCRRKGTEESIRSECRYFWDRYGEKPIKRALNHSACVSIPRFIELCNEFKKLNEKM